MNNFLNLINRNKVKTLILLICLLGLLAFIGAWSAVSGGHDKQNKVILFFKNIIPTPIYQKARDTIFIIPSLKERNKFYKTQVDKYEQGLNGNLFNTEIFISQIHKKKFELKEFFLPFKRLDLTLGWHGEENSRRAHHFEIVNDKIIVISGEAETIFFNKKNIFNEKLDQTLIPNNLKKILNETNSKLIGIRDLFYEDNKLYISMLSQNKKGITINAYQADLNFDKLVFEIFFKTDHYWPTYNVYSGGRLEKYKDNKILFSIGFQGVWPAAQNLESRLGKIIAIDKDSKEFEFVSIGHRNPQGLKYIKDQNIIVNTEHGPKGGDEININNLTINNGRIPNFGWAVSSYGVNYSGPDTLKKSHSKYGFDEPLKWYTPAIGISQVEYFSDHQSPDNKKYLYVSSLRAGSIYVYNINDSFDKILEEDRIYFHSKRIRDIKYDDETKLFFIIFEFTPSIAILKLL
tara:strand:+ start:1574 stop:2956 length:1383 start_codon:yes stop_codon:yes gene_type:complete